MYFLSSYYRNLGLTPWNYIVLYLDIKCLPKKYMQSIIYRCRKLLHNTLKSSHNLTSFFFVHSNTYSATPMKKTSLSFYKPLSTSTHISLCFFPVCNQCLLFWTSHLLLHAQIQWSGIVITNCSWMLLWTSGDTHKLEIAHEA